jgi:hypothetical protein
MVDTIRVLKKIASSRSLTTQLSKIHLQKMEDEEGPVTKLAAAAALAQLELQQSEKAQRAAREAQELRTQAALVGETALALARGMGSGGRMSLSQEQLRSLKETRRPQSLPTTPVGGTFMYWGDHLGLFLFALRSF